MIIILCPINHHIYHENYLNHLMIIPFFNAPKPPAPPALPPALRVDPGTATLLLEDSRSLEEAAGISRGAVGSGSV